MPGAAEQPGFHLTGANQGFNSRSDDIFGGLDMLASQGTSTTNTSASDLQKADPVDEPISGSDQRRFDECPTRYYRPREPKRDLPSRQQRDGYFRPPVRRPPRSQRLPDYKKNPGKWTCYDLSDVSKDDLSERSNTAAAFQFLQERRRSREMVTAASPSTSEIEVDAHDKGQKHVFVKKSKDGGTEEIPKEETPKFTGAGAMRVMPEYNFGAKKPRLGQNKPSSSHPKMSDPDSVQLSHLEDEKLADGNEDSVKIDGSRVPEKEEEPAGHQSQVTADLPDKAKSSDSSDVIKFKSRKNKSRAAVRRRHDDDGDEDSEKE